MVQLTVRIFDSSYLLHTLANEDVLAAMITPDAGGNTIYLDSVIEQLCDGFCSIVILDGEPDDAPAETVDTAVNHKLPAYELVVAVEVPQGVGEGHPISPADDRAVAKELNLVGL
jgi:hypothetical protein